METMWLLAVDPRDEVAPDCLRLRTRRIRHQLPLLWSRYVDLWIYVLIYVYSRTKPNVVPASKVVVNIPIFSANHRWLTFNRTWNISFQWPKVIEWYLPKFQVIHIHRVVKTSPWNPILWSKKLPLRWNSIPKV